MVAGPDNDSSEGPGRGRPRQMTRDLIVQEAAKIPHEEFSLARLADALGTSPQSLYHYFPNKESIFTAIAQEIADSVPMVDPDLHWKEYLREIMLGYRRFLRENDYPFARGLNYSGLTIFRVAGQPSTTMMDRLDRFLAVMGRDGFGPEASLEVWVILQNFIRRSDLHRAPSDALEKVWKEMVADVAAIGDGAYPEIERASRVECPNTESVHRSMVEVLIEGISVRFGVK